jgi:hypothetical protein
MNKRFFIAWIVVFVAWMAGDFVVHGLLLGADYAKLSSLYRPEAEAQAYFPWMLLAHVILAGAFIWVYVCGVQAKPWLSQGLRFGLAIALLTAVPTYMIYYAVQPMPMALVIKQVVFASVLLLVLGVVVAFMYRGQERNSGSA